ncbi:MAG: C-terminal binding protein [Verrucomicrobiota bacterium]
MKAPRVVITDHQFGDISPQRAVLNAAGAELVELQCSSAQDLIAAAEEADAMLVQFAPVTASVIGAMRHCKVIVRYGIGVDNIDVVAARKKGIPVCNVPDYCTDEVADHTLALALALGRQLTITDRFIREGIWNISPVNYLPAFGEMTYGVAGFGEIGRAVLRRARGFKFKCIAHDPSKSEETFQAEGVRRVGLEELFQEADILSLHASLDDSSLHMVNRQRLGLMKKHAILVNTARGKLIDTTALIEALEKGRPAYAGLDVFESEPLPEHHPLRKLPNVLMTSHIAWFSANSTVRLQRYAAEEAVRALQDQPLLHELKAARPVEKVLVSLWG